MSDVHPNVVRVVAAAKERGLEIATKRFPEGTKTAADAAAAIGVSVGQIVKSLVFGVDGEIVMKLREPLMGVAPGQTAVLYVGTRVLGQATIDRTVSAVSADAETIGA